MEPTDEQKREFWELCGLTKFKNPIPGDESISAKPSILYIEPPGIDLNNLFQYAVPKLDLCAEIHFTMSPVKGEREITVSINVPSYGKYQSVSYKHYSWCDKDPALALFWAIYPILKETNSE